MAATIDLKSLPSLPGFNLPDFREQFHKPQTLGIVNGQRVETKDLIRAKDRFKPGFDRMVLRFSGYFKEAVVETNLENFRVRSVLIYFYLEDDSCHVIEPRQDNSGIPQGELIRRHKFPGPDGGFLKWQDIKVGSQLMVYGRAIMLTDCDPFTRTWYEENGMNQPEAQEAEVDPFTTTRVALKERKATQPRTHEKLYREVMLGGGHINADMQQFLENDRRVLRFFAIMEDTSTSQYERRPFVILFFLADDQVEIRELYPLNCGRDNFPVFFRKGKMPIGSFEAHGPQDQPRDKSEFVHGHDFRVNQHVTLLGNFQFFLYDADDFTRDYFRNVLGRELEAKVDVRQPSRTVPRAPTPPYTGYGSWDDSMASVTHLIPKQPRKDFNKLYQHDGKVLRFKARFANPKHEDRERIFVISFYLFDDTLSIHEPPQRNLGVVAGKFLEKAVHLNQLTGALFRPEDLTPGQFVKVYNHEFEILDMDDYTRKLFHNPNAPRCQFDLPVVLQKLRESCRQQFPLVRDVFRRLDEDHDGVLTLQEFQLALEKFGFMLAEEEVLQIMNHFDPKGKGQVGYNEFCDGCLEQDYVSGMFATTKAAAVNGNATTYGQKAKYAASERAEVSEVRRAVKEMGDIVYKKSGVLPKLFKEIRHMTHEPLVSCEQIQYAFQQIGHTLDLDTVVRTALYIFPETEDLQRVDYVEMFKQLNATFHDFNYSTR